MSYRLNLAGRHFTLAEIAAEFNGGTVELRSGSRPASVDDAAQGTVLVVIDLPTPAFGSPSSGSVAKAGTWETDQDGADESGDIGHFRLISSDEAKVIDGTAGTSGSGASMIVNRVDVQSGGHVEVTAFSIDKPAAAA